MIHRVSYFVFAALSSICLHAADSGGIAAVDKPAATEGAGISDLTMAQALDLLVKNNLTVVAARHGVDAARAAKVIAAYHPNPTLNVSAEQFDTDRLGHKLVADSGQPAQRTYTIGIQQLLETGGKRRLRIESADSQLQANESQVLDAIRVQSMSMKQAFLTALLSRENLTVAKETMESIKTTEDLISKNVKSGNTPETDLWKFQANKGQFERDLITAELGYKQALADVANLLGEHASASNSPARVNSVSGNLIPPEAEPELDMLRQRSESRPDVVAAKKNFDTAEKAVALAHAQRSVDVTVGPEFQRVGNNNTVGFSFSVPLPAYNHQQGNIQQAEAQVRQSDAQWKIARQQAATDVEKALAQYRSSKSILKTLNEESLPKSKSALEASQKAYEKGGTSLLDLLDARRTYNQMRTTLNQALFDANLSFAQIESSSGFDVSKPAEPAKQEPAPK